MGGVGPRRRAPPVIRVPQPRALLPPAGSPAAALAVGAAPPFDASGAAERGFVSRQGKQLTLGKDGWRAFAAAGATAALHASLCCMRRRQREPCAWQRPCTRVCTKCRRIRARPADGKPFYFIGMNSYWFIGEGGHNTAYRPGWDRRRQHTCTGQHCSALRMACDTLGPSSPPPPDTRVPSCPRLSDLYTEAWGRKRIEETLDAAQVPAAVWSSCN